jgi:hypothetical protein
MNTEKKPFLEAKDFYRIYRETKPYFLFQSFLESLKSDSNTALVESIQKGVNVILESAAAALRKLNPQSFTWLEEGMKMMNSIKASIKEGQVKENKYYQAIKNAVATRENEGSKILLLQSLYPAMAAAVDRALLTHSVKAEKGTNVEYHTAEHAMDELQKFVLKEVIPDYDPSKGAEFQQYGIGLLWERAIDAVHDYLEIEDIKAWDPEKNYDIKEKKQNINYITDVNSDSDAPLNVDTFIDHPLVRYDGKVYRRIGDPIIPPEFRNVPPDGKLVGAKGESILDDNGKPKVVDEVLDYWELGKSEEGAFRTSRISDVEETEQRGGVHTKGDTTSNKLGKITSGKQETFEEPGKTFDIQNFYDRINDIIDMETKDENIASYLKELFEKNLIGNKTNTEKEQTRELKAQYNIPSNAAMDNEISRIKQKVIKDMKKMGKEHFMV